MGNSVFLALCNAQGQRVMERRVKANLDAISQALGPSWERVRALVGEIHMQLVLVCGRAARPGSRRALGQSG